MNATRYFFCTLCIVGAVSMSYALLDPLTIAPPPIDWEDEPLAIQDGEFIDPDLGLFGYVISAVFDSTNEGNYVYMYLVINDHLPDFDDSEKQQILGAEISFFSIAIPPRATILDYAVDPDPPVDLPFPMTTPNTWAPVMPDELAIIAMQAHFYFPSINPGYSSAILWLESPQDWTQAEAHLFGQYQGMNVSDDDLLLVPNPEPATVALLSIGGGLLLRKNRESKRN